MILTPSSKRSFEQSAESGRFGLTPVVAPVEALLSEVTLASDRDGPLLPLAIGLFRCGAVRRTGYSLRVRNLRLIEFR